MPNVQRRLPGEKWSAFSTKQPSAFSGQQQAPPATPLQTAAQIAQTKTAGIPPGPGFTPPRQPQPAQPQPGYGGATVGPAFALKGVGRYVNRNANGLQFNRPAIGQAVAKGVQSYSEAQYFRHSGMGAAIRHTLGMPQMPSHMNDYLRARHNTNVRGQDPHSITAQVGSVDPDEYMHF